MACLTEAKIHEYVAGDLSPLEAQCAKDHLAGCAACRATAARYRRLEKVLAAPVWIEPPESLIGSVMRRLYPPPYPLYSSIAALIAASLLFLVSWIYIYFNFSTNSLLQAIHLSSKSTSNWIVKLVSAVDTMFLMIQATFKSASHFLHTLLGVNVQPGVLGGIFLGLSLLLIYAGFSFVGRTVRERDR
jgi:hypothetical protein